MGFRTDEKFAPEGFINYVFKIINHTLKQLKNIEKIMKIKNTF